MCTGIHNSKLKNPFPSYFYQKSSNFAKKQSHFSFWLFSERIWNHHLRFRRCYFAHSKPIFASILDNFHQEMHDFLLGGSFIYVRWHLCYFSIFLLPPCVHSVRPFIRFTKFFIKLTRTSFFPKITVHRTMNEKLH